MLPASGLIAFSFQEYSNVADHYATFSTMALALLFCFLKITNLWRGVVAILFLLPFLYQAHLTNTYWSDSKTFYNHILEVNPASYMAVGSLGILSFRQGDFKEAKIKFKTADEMNPQHVYAAINLANLLFSEGDREAAGKIYATRCRCCHRLQKRQF